MGVVLAIEVDPELLQRLQAAAQRQESLERVAVTLLEESLMPAPPVEESERERVRRALEEAGLLSEIGDHLRTRIDRAVRHEEVVAALGRAGGKPLSEIILEQRGPKE